MSPLQIKIILHYYEIVGDYDADKSTQELADMDMLERAYDKTNTWKLTKRGQCYVDYILSVPLPEQTYVIKV